MTNKDAIKFLESWNKLRGLTGTLFLIQLKRNKMLIEKHLMSLKIGAQETEAYSEFKTIYLAEKEKYADLDEKGNPKMVQMPNNPNYSTYVITEKAADWEKVEKKLLKKYDKVIQEQEDIAKKEEELINSECTAMVTKFKPKTLPPNLSLEQLEAIEIMVDYS